jgi:hypothetical protein
MYLLNIPSVNYSPDINDLFANFYHNWDTLSPALWLLYGTLFAFFLLGVLKKKYYDD